jgi:hypothetical protein
MSKLAVIKSVVTSKAFRGGLMLRKYSPEILVATGIVGIVASTVMACRATLRAEDVVDRAKDKLDKVKLAKETADTKVYTDKDHRKDLVVVYVQTAVDFVTLYGPAVTLGLVSVGCILKAHNILKTRNLALIAAYNAVEKSFSDYRKRVVSKYGAEEDRCFKNGITKSTVSVSKMNDDGTTTTEDIVMETIDPNGPSEYARFFDEAASQWSKNSGYNLTFLRCQQNFANDLLHAHGHIFLNEVYDMIGVPRSKAGAVVGWTLGVGDDFVDFGIFDPENMKARDFVNGYERSILLDFNVDGIIYDLI